MLVRDGFQICFQESRSALLSRPIDRLASHKAPSRLACQQSQSRLACLKAVNASTMLQGPPASYNFRADSSQTTHDCIKTLHPQLYDLVQDGTLVVWKRPESYVERRSDGYQEPLMVYLVGTAHVSLKSAQDVQRVIEAVQPCATVVELCKSRTAVMWSGEEEEVTSQSSSNADTSNSISIKSGSFVNTVEEGSTLASFNPEGRESQSGDDILKGQASSQHDSSTSATSSLQNRRPSWMPASASPSNMLQISGGSGGFTGALSRSFQLGGQSALLLRVLMSNLAGLAADQFGVRGGGEFVAARVASEAVGAQIVLGDRPIEITLERAWEALPLKRRFQLCWELVVAGIAGSPAGSGGGGQMALTEQLLESMKQDDAISAFFEQLSERYPELPSPLIHERDMYLAWSLKRSKAVNGAKAVVGVVGRGHLRGITYALSNDSHHLRFSDLVGGKNSKKNRHQEAAKAVGRFALETAIFAACYYLWTSQVTPGGI
ncbi:hypothetical protein CEUSTIGMA_g1221.t1 [Chlamydomonas eustigma]|uniref:TraB domain-containing protein n=1 Tax=Chlamydomonas eustigma TaxID=1157962 RepID=A0A250WTB6_9CHLO|nr:hypothetical protein CEUSTIGMA_g1221.t1 [Chlamydomonas eustigma]|eukprot:GAX73770.1 hypothetical protein CEUSTIGMA_g1221.t1 [Chlamydomonas eustigma]